MLQSCWEYGGGGSLETLTLRPDSQLILSGLQSSYQKPSDVLLLNHTWHHVSCWDSLLICQRVTLCVTYGTFLLTGVKEHWLQTDTVRFPLLMLSILNRTTLPAQSSNVTVRTSQDKHGDSSLGFLLLQQQQTRPTWRYNVCSKTFKQSGPGSVRTHRVHSWNYKTRHQIQSAKWRCFMGVRKKKKHIPGVEFNFR